MFLPLLSKRCASVARSAYINRNAVFRQTRQAEVVSVPSSVFFGHGRLGTTHILPF